MPRGSKYFEISPKNQELSDEPRGRMLGWGK
jgi:hypothetical protein